MYYANHPLYSRTPASAIRACVLVVHGETAQVNYCLGNLPAQPRAMPAFDPSLKNIVFHPITVWIGRGIPNQGMPRVSAWKGLKK